MNLRFPFFAWHNALSTALLGFLFFPTPLYAQTVSQNKNLTLDDYCKPLKWRCIGPFRGGRSVCASGVVNQHQTYFMGTTGGGLWKTEDAGHHWANVSDGYFQTGSVGAVAVAESDPNVIYVGMGEHAPRGVMTSHGDGAYKSTDSGKTWQHLGLAKTEHISRIVIHPKNPNLVYVAAQGALHGDTSERGIYKSADGGKTWQQVLFVNDRTGCAELSIDFSNPQVLYATMWEHQRKPWIIISGGEGSGVYKTSDGGDTWNPIEKGLPEEKGKMAIAVSRSNPEKVYLLVESDSEQEKGGLFSSSDAGGSWSRVSNDHRLTQRAWYYTEVFVDPLDEHTIYVLSAPALRSIDGGKNWETLSGTHGDYHDLWINPHNSRNMVIANDGGAAITFNQGASWSRQSNMPTAQLYRLNIDNRFPYRIYAGQQDNTSLAIASLELGSDGITERSWKASAGGESAFLAFDPDNPRYVMGGSYLGTIEVLDTEAAAGTNIMSAPIQYLGRAARDMKYLFNWNAPIIWSRHEPNTFYHAAQYLLRTHDLGQTWEEVSPDLTRNQDHRQGKGGGPLTVEAVGAENYGTISYVAESPHQQGVIWTGSDDGLVQLTRDAGKTWTNVTPQDLDECLINAIEISPHDQATAYIATTRYKFNDKRPGLYKTTDYGQSWTSISDGIPDGAFTRVVREVPQRKDLLFAGTEVGLYMSRDGGSSWQPFQLNLPVTPILDLMIRHDDIIVATSGRSIWIFDDLELVCQLVERPEGIQVFKPASAFLSNHSSPLNETDLEFDGTDPLNGVNPANGVVIYYQLPELPESEHVQLEIRDSEGQLVNRFSSEEDKSFEKYAGGPSAPPVLSKEQGLNRFVWNMRHATMPGVPEVYIEGSYRGHKAIPGTYQLILKQGEQTFETNAEILAHPLISIAEADYSEYHRVMTEMEQSLTEMHTITNQLHRIDGQLRKLLDTLGDEESLADLKEQGKLLADRIKGWDDEMVQRKSKAYDDVENFPNKFTAEYLFLINQTESDVPRVTQASKDRRTELDVRWEAFKQQANLILNDDLPTFNEKLWQQKIGAIWVGR